jgi:hypothetical protein
MTSEVPETLGDSIRAALDELEWRHQTLDDGRILARVKGSQAVYLIHFLVNESTQILGCYATTGCLVPEDRRMAIAEAITRANWGLPIGCFELDFSDGELRFRASMDVEGSILATKMVHNLAFATINTHDRYHQALMRVAFGDADPASAIAAAEG